MEEEYLEKGAAPTAETASDDRTYCFCGKPSTQEMICCDNENCRYKWFHYDCVNVNPLYLTQEKWYCPFCRNSPSQSFPVCCHSPCALWIKWDNWSEEPNRLQTICRGYLFVLIESLIFLFIWPIEMVVPFTGLEAVE